MFEYIEPGPLGLKWAVLPSKPVRRAFVLTACVVLVVALIS